MRCNVKAMLAAAVTSRFDPTLNFDPHGRRVYGEQQPA